MVETPRAGNPPEVLKTLSDLNPTSKAYASVPQLADALYDGEVDAIILNDGYLPILEQTEGYTDFDDYTRILKQFDFTKEVAPGGTQRVHHRGALRGLLQRHRCPELRCQHPEPQ